MVVSVSVVLLLFVIAALLMRSKNLKVSHALVCGLLGFFLAGSSLAPTIQSTVASTADLVSTIRP
ncbi:hypothetical protein [Actinacidiphila paucisporea]|uniref:Uncharacterized protein n=1 Tax=Actinacidiphila paucisporea TaxID=310782 RepID=A0A1M7BY99_9ACTN|nr:hypothetical protein [Actinacidiphila paucisporea]SHL59961.1 hypothetical protein SAMN05216499_10587 [Actinacidiphila paucisporea]